LELHYTQKHFKASATGNFRNSFGQLHQGRQKDRDVDMPDNALTIHYCMASRFQQSVKNKSFHFLDAWTRVTKI